MTAGLLGPGTGGAQEGTGAATVAAPKPPKGARAVVYVSPNPTAKRGQEVTITGHCGGGKGLKGVIAGIDRKLPLLEYVRIIDDNPKGSWPRRPSHRGPATASARCSSTAVVRQA
ncbi:hypothetical protein [Nonomuraea sp. KM88]|uniref:hypothetical protein n=1 Tax=Nonomuraea sp. KM88 TaxID=3457427 RepID=UPI003FCD14AC